MTEENKINHPRWNLLDDIFLKMDELWIDFVNKNELTFVEMDIILDLFKEKIGRAKIRSYLQYLMDNYENKEAKGDCYK